MPPPLPPAHLLAVVHALEVVIPEVLAELGVLSLAHALQASKGRQQALSATLMFRSQPAPGGPRRNIWRLRLAPRQPALCLRALHSALLA